MSCLYRICPVLLSKAPSQLRSYNVLYVNKIESSFYKIVIVYFHQELIILQLPWLSLGLYFEEPTANIPCTGCYWIT